MNIILLCKGNSINQLTKEEILKNDIIAWANIHNLSTSDTQIPKKIDYLFIREESFVNDLTEEHKKIINKLNIKHVITTGIRCNKILKYDVEKHIDSKTIKFGKASASTGLIALYYLTSLKPKTITIAGLDLFEKNKPLYYFNNMDDNLTAKKTNDSLISSLNKEGNLKTTFHYPNETINYIINLIKNNETITFIFYTENENLKNNIKKLKNVIIS